MSRMLALAARVAGAQRARPISPALLAHPRRCFSARAQPAPPANATSPADAVSRTNISPAFLLRRSSTRPYPTTSIFNWLKLCFQYSPWTYEALRSAAQAMVTAMRQAPAGGKKAAQVAFRPYNTLVDVDEQLRPLLTKTPPLWNQGLWRLLHQGEIDLPPDSRPVDFNDRVVSLFHLLSDPDFFRASTTSLNFFHQYTHLKRSSFGHLLMIENGDFLESFLSDAILISNAGVSKLTQRYTSRIPATGSPVTTLPAVLKRLFAHKHTVAIARQGPLTTPPGSNSLVVPRSISRYYTPGTLLHHDIGENETSTLMTISRIPRGRKRFSYGVVLTDLSAATMRTFTCEDTGKLQELMDQFCPSEILLPLEQAEVFEHMGLEQKYFVSYTSPPNLQDLLLSFGGVPAVEANVNHLLEQFHRLPLSLMGDVNLPPMAAVSVAATSPNSQGGALAAAAATAENATLGLLRGQPSAQSPGLTTHQVQALDRFGPLIEDIVTNSFVNMALKTHLAPPSFTLPTAAAFEPGAIASTAAMFAGDKLWLDLSALSQAEVLALAQSFKYLHHVFQSTDLPILSLLPGSRDQNQTAMRIDPFTSRALDLHLSSSALLSQDANVTTTNRFRNIHFGSLFGSLDTTETRYGRSKLLEVTMSPLTDTRIINQRQSMVEFFVQNQAYLGQFRDALRELRTLDRQLNVVSTQKPSLAMFQALMASFDRISALRDLLTQMIALSPEPISEDISSILGGIVNDLDEIPRELVQTLRQTFISRKDDPTSDEPPFVVHPHASTQMAQLHLDLVSVVRQINLYMTSLCRSTGLGMGFSLVEQELAGLFLVVSPVLAQRIGLDLAALNRDLAVHPTLAMAAVSGTVLAPTRTHFDGTTVNPAVWATRVVIPPAWTPIRLPAELQLDASGCFTTPRLLELHQQLVDTRRSILTLEQDILDCLHQSAIQQVGILQKIIYTVSWLDVLSSWAFNAVQLNYSRPIVDNSLAFDIIGGRHPVLELSVAGRLHEQRGYYLRGGPPTAAGGGGGGTSAEPDAPIKTVAAAAAAAAAAATTTAAATANKAGRRSPGQRSASEEGVPASTIVTGPTGMQLHNDHQSILSLLGARGARVPFGRDRDQAASGSGSAAGKRATHNFIKNDCNLSERPLLYITGANMGGKSTYLRQNALIAIMAQMGSFVPATRAHIGVVDRIFARIGSADDPLNNQSTFMVEMSEASMACNEASPRSLVIMDELGRGTSPEEGAALAFSVLRYLHQQTGCRMIFASHFHSLTPWLKLLGGVSFSRFVAHKNPEDSSRLYFPYRLEAGAADTSYATYVAQLSGMPKELIRDADAFFALQSKADEPPLMLDHAHQAVTPDVERFLSKIHTSRFPLSQKSPPRCDVKK
ncbi:hypothetical protein H696_01469 [Fonticula alba]|uniref:DNA mismatch repair protein n=1 Tax=Fonticula alba TaxID=691883 RepID=A0A058ZDM3_FONAL|nr:hypothetical protein H696_01469 [Fonticula alba]KCV72061.1 hypothetical protein H696_01469 [Fonticula alba]|eukprot:XP_009493639.1 hypothetical protein H696_01469 [Fonticula alba]